MPLDADDLDRIFRTARTHRAWLAGTVTDETLRAPHESMQWGLPRPAAVRRGSSS